MKSLPKTSYINAQDLNDVLIEYFNGTLNLFPYIHRITFSLMDLHPSNTLWGQVTAEDIYYCLSQLSSPERAAIENLYTSSEKSEEYLTEGFVLSSGFGSLHDYKAYYWSKAFESLKERIIAIL